MTCVEVEQELVEYHFGTETPAARAAVEAHLPTCPNCVRSFLVLRRELEFGAEELPLPSAAARARLRSAVAEQLRPAPAPWKWWQRPFAFASAAVVVAGALVLTFRIATAEVTGPRTIAARAGAPGHAGEQARVAASSAPCPVADADTGERKTAADRAVFERDAGCCQFSGADGQKCGSTWQLELHHLEPAKQTGSSQPDDLEIRCKPHNHPEAKVDFGAEFIERLVAQKRARARARAEQASRSLPPVAATTG